MGVQPARRIESKTWYRCWSSGFTPKGQLLSGVAPTTANQFKGQMQRTNGVILLLLLTIGLYRHQRHRHNACSLLQFIQNATSTWPRLWTFVATTRIKLVSIGQLVARMRIRKAQLSSSEGDEQA
uniref:Uncharacterized protein n=1 Tax=Spongospora subterranea TaxID=70186 RepID=A0A0H5RBV3_9EUKA|eukprot:CRZ11251.1 hypothetical protein [Spongospora subterranea]